MNKISKYEFFKIVLIYSIYVTVYVLSILSLKIWKLIILLQPNDDTLIQVEGASTHIICNGEEIVRTKIRDTLLRCLQKLWQKHFDTSCNLSFFHTCISAILTEPRFLNVSVCNFPWNNILQKGIMWSLYAEDIHNTFLVFVVELLKTFLMSILKLLVLPVYNTSLLLFVIELLLKKMIDFFL